MYVFLKVELSEMQKLTSAFLSPIDVHIAYSMLFTLNSLMKENSWQFMLSVSIFSNKAEPLRVCFACKPKPAKWSQPEWDTGMLSHTSVALFITIGLQEQFHVRDFT